MITLRAYIGGVGVLLILVGAGLIIANANGAGAHCIKGLAYDVCTGAPNLWLPGLIVAAVGVIVLVGAIVTKPRSTK